MTIATYSTLSGASKYAQELREQFPEWGFRPTIVLDFKWGVGVLNSAGKIIALAEKRPRVRR